MTTNERFDELWGNYNPQSDTKGLDFHVKTFISQEKNILLDQAIEEGEKMKTCDDECYKDHDCNVARIQDETLSQYISKLKELKN